MNRSGRKRVRHDRQFGRGASFCAEYSGRSRRNWEIEVDDKERINQATGHTSKQPWEQVAHGWATSCFCTPDLQWQAPSGGFIDAHCHLEALDGCWLLPASKGGQPGYGGWWQRSGDDAVAQVRHALDSQPPQVLAVISNCCDPNDFAWYEGLMAAWDSGELQDERLYWTVGVHPYGADGYEKWLAKDPSILERMLKLAAHPRCVAVGECGLDYCKAYESHEAQRRVFAQVCQLAVRLDKTLVVHARDAGSDAMDILRANVPADWPIHLHGYTGEVEDVEELLETFSRLYVGFCGVLTFGEFISCCSRCAPLYKPGCRFCGGEYDNVKRDLDGLARAVPFDRLLLETDAPYMSPVPLCARSCQPWMASLTAEAVARRKGVQVAEIFDAALRNTCRLYGLDNLISSSTNSSLSPLPAMAVEER